jgi:DNA-binding phage protein
MTTDQLIAELRSIRYARTSLTDIARTAGISRSMLYEVIVKGAASPRTKEALERALQNVRKRQGNIVRS